MHDTYFLDQSVSKTSNLSLWFPLDPLISLKKSAKSQKKNTKTNQNAVDFPHFSSRPHFWPYPARGGGSRDQNQSVTLKKKTATCKQFYVQQSDAWESEFQVFFFSLCQSSVGTIMWGDFGVHFLIRFDSIRERVKIRYSRKLTDIIILILISFWLFEELQGILKMEWLGTNIFSFFVKSIRIFGIDNNQNKASPQFVVSCWNSNRQILKPLPGKSNTFDWTYLKQWASLKISIFKEKTRKNQFQ